MTYGAASTICSKLSRTSRRCFDRSAAASCSGGARPTTSRRSRAWAIAETTRSGSRTEAREAKTAPSAYSSANPAATSIASRVFPTPPGPVSVTRRISGRRSRARTASSSRSRPTSGVSGKGSVLARSQGGGLTTVQEPPCRSWCVCRRVRYTARGGHTRHGKASTSSDQTRDGGTRWLGAPDRRRGALLGGPSTAQTRRARATGGRCAKSQERWMSQDRRQ